MHLTRCCIYFCMYWVNIFLGRIEKKIYRRQELPGSAKSEKIIFKFDYMVQRI